MKEMQIHIIHDGQEVHHAVSAMVEVAIELKEENPLASAMALWVAKGMRADLERQGKWLGGSV